MSGVIAPVRTLVTLAILTAVLLLAVLWGVSAVTAPFEEESGPVGTCEPIDVAAGEEVYPSQVVVSVLNAGTREGLAGSVMGQLIDRGFAEGSSGNAPADTVVDDVQVWTPEPENPAVRLVASKLGDDVEVVRRDTTLPGVVVVVGNDFRRVKRGRDQVVADTDTRICSAP